MSLLKRGAEERRIYHRYKLQKTIIMKIKLSNANDVVQIEKSNGTVIDIGQIHADVAENTSAVGGLKTAVGNIQEDVDRLKKGFSPLTNAHIAKTAKWEDALMEGDDLQWVGARSIEPQNSDQPLAADMVWNEDFQWV